MVDGEVIRLIDLPLESPLARGADEAWRLQAAMDSLAGQPQSVRVAASQRAGRAIVNFFSPVPSWAQRRLDIVGTPLLRSKGALLSYALPEQELDEELAALARTMWIASVTSEGTSDAEW